MDKKTTNKQIAPTVLGSVVALTGTVCGNNACDASTDYAKGTDTDVL